MLRGPPAVYPCSIPGAAAPYYINGYCVTLPAFLKRTSDGLERTGGSAVSPAAALIRPKGAFRWDLSAPLSPREKKGAAHIKPIGIPHSMRGPSDPGRSSCSCCKAYDGALAPPFLIQRKGAGRYPYLDTNPRRMQQGVGGFSTYSISGESEKNLKRIFQTGFRFWRYANLRNRRSLSKKE